MEHPVFTIIMSTYNRKDVLPRAIESVLSQTFADFELLVIDNGSTDNTRFVVEGIKDPRLRYVLNPTPTDSCDAPRNLGIQIARGSLISFLDDDDIWYPQRLEKVKDAFIEHPDALAVCHNANRTINGRIEGALIRPDVQTDNLYERLLYEGNCLSPCTTTIKSELLRQLNGFDLRKEFNRVADHDLWLRMAAKGAKTHFIDELLGEYIVTGDNLSVVDPGVNARFAFLIKEYILDYEKKPIFRISQRGMWRLFQLYYVVGRTFFEVRGYKNACKYFLQAISFILLKPALLLNLYRRQVRKIIKTRKE